MSYRNLSWMTAVAVALIAQPARQLGAQESAQIDPGMTREEVVERLGKPLNERQSGEFSYLFYRNGCERSCGMNDLVTLQNGKVVDAIFRSTTRVYGGNSTSPSGVTPERTTQGSTGGSATETVRRAGRGGIIIAAPADGAEAAPRGTVTGVEVTQPGSAAGTTSPVSGSGGAQAAVQPSTSGTSGSGPGLSGGTAGGNAPQVIAPGGNAPQVGSPESPTAPPARQPGEPRPIMPVAIPGAKVNPADSVRALTPDRPTAIPGAKVNPADSIRAEAIRRQMADTTRKPN